MKICKFNDGSWFVTMSGISFVIDAVFSSAKVWEQLSETECEAHTATFFLVTQGGKKHFDVSSYKYVPLDKTILIPPDFSKKVPKFLKHDIRVANPDESFEVGPLKISAINTQTSLFDPFLLKKAQSVCYFIESETELLIVSGVIDSIDKIERKNWGRKSVAILPFGLSEGSSLLSDAVLPAKNILDTQAKLAVDFLIPFSDNKGNVVNNTILTLTREQMCENKIKLVETGQCMEL